MRRGKLPLGRNHFLRLRPPHLVCLHIILNRPYGGYHQSLTAKYEFSIKTLLFARKVSVGQGGTRGDGTRITRGEDLNGGTFSFSTLRPQRILLFP